ncbi:MAG: sulfatase-like hydrolase/transferase [Paracoccus sp. (in: a-proteobacteria)]|uniref:sulfatase-like hydrolase/transferase n=1 Tax=Paracoccus sp. TaxID=267 RepID=UPI0039E6FA1F
MSRPNVIVFFTDQQRFDTSGLHGNPMGLTPNFDRIAREGTHVAQALACQPLCGPARAALQTGRYATSAGVWRNEIALSPQIPTLAQIFAEGGWRTGYIGKWHLAGADPVPRDARGGYRDWLGANHLEFVSDAYDTRLTDGDGIEHKLPGYRVDAMTDAAIRYIDAHQAEPFLLFVSFLEPHHQNHTDDYPAPTGYREEMQRDLWTPPDLQALQGTSSWHLAGYYGMVKRLDEAFGRLLDALKSLDLARNTIVLFTSDHGCHFKTRNDEYKRSCHDVSIRVPMALTGPGFDSGGQVRALVNTTDIAPTLIDAAGLTVPKGMEGRSILPLLRDPKTDWRKESFIQISETETGRAIRTQRWKYGVTALDSRTDEAADSYNESFLYDLDADPYEMVNLIGFPAFAAVSADLRVRLLDWIERVERRQPRIAAHPEREQRQHRLHPAQLLDDYRKGLVGRSHGGA